MPYVLSKASLAKLEGVHPDLVKVVKRAIRLSKIDFRVNEGPRTESRQRKLFANGGSTTLKSRHLTGHAVDLVALINGKPEWAWPLYYQIADAMKSAARELGVRIVWGGDWKRFKDGPHFELNRAVYPPE